MAVIHTANMNHTADGPAGSEMDHKIAGYLEKYQGDALEEVIAGEDWKVFFRLSQLRTGLISWYDFGADSSVLEIGAGFGTLTEVLCRRCGHVTATERSLFRAKCMERRLAEYENLDIYVGDIGELVFDRKFDCVLVIGLLERMGRGAADRESYAAYLNQAARYLKPEGRLLAAADNRFGLRYLCGAVDPHTGRAFGSINQYSSQLADRNVARSFSRRELEEIFEAAGFVRHKFYYPLPDYMLPQLIYTDTYLPERNLKERLIPYYLRNDTLVASEQDLYDDIISNGVFPFFANSFLVEGTRQGVLGKVEYAAISTDRGRAGSYATVIAGRERGEPAGGQVLGKAGGSTAVRLAGQELERAGQSAGEAVPGQEADKGTVRQSTGTAAGQTLDKESMSCGTDRDDARQNADGRLAGRDAGKVYFPGRRADKEGVEYSADRAENGKSAEYPADRALGGKSAEYPAGRIVYKMPLYREGIESAKKLYGHIQDLDAHGIPVVPHKLRADGSLELPYVAYPTLSNYIKELMPRDIDAFLCIIDKLFRYIMQSSEQCTPAESGKGAANLLAEHLIGLGRYSREELAERDFGPILRRAYIELIPLNCFYDEAGGRFLYFDQEFMRECYPAGYILFRAIHYIYVFTPNAEDYYPERKLIEAYGMTDTWAVYLAEEEEFLREVRNQEKYAQFYKWAGVDWKRMRDNALRLESEEEKIANYQVSDTMKKTWAVELEMLDEVDRICRKYHLTYVLVHGSLLGAVRHKGFIPWDDDLDIAMARKDYEAFLQAAPKELSVPLSLHNMHTDREVFWGSFSRIRNEDTTGMEARELGHGGNLGIWIDILPYDVCTEDDGEFQRKEKRLERYYRLINAKVYGGEYKAYMGLKPWQWMRYRLWSKFWKYERLCAKIEETTAAYTEKESAEIAFFTGAGKHRRLAKSDFDGVVYLDFAGRKVPAPKGYESYLRAILGHDYMKYPPEEERKPKHRGIWDPFTPYRKYVELLADTFRDCRGREIILFGAGLMFEDYMKKYGDKYHPAFIVDNDENKWGRYRFGIEIKSPRAILEVPENRRKVIICSYYYLEIEKQLKEMGIKSYQIYVQKLEWIMDTERKRHEGVVMRPLR